MICSVFSCFVLQLKRFDSSICSIPWITVLLKNREVCQYFFTLSIRPTKALRRSCTFDKFLCRRRERQGLFRRGARNLVAAAPLCLFEGNASQSTVAAGRRTKCLCYFQAGNSRVSSRVPSNHQSLITGHSEVRASAPALDELSFIVSAARTSTWVLWCHRTCRLAPGAALPGHPAVGYQTIQASNVHQIGKPAAARVI